MCGKYQEEFKVTLNRLIERPMPLSSEKARELGKRSGAKRKGLKLPRTLERLRVEAQLKQRILLHADSLLNSQLALANGLTHVYRIDEKKDGNKIVREHVLVTDAEEIKELLDEHEGGNGMVGDTYYYISVKDPNGMAIDSLFNRGIGKPTDSVDITSKGEAVAITPELLKTIQEFEKQLNQKNVNSSDS